MNSSTSAATASQERRLPYSAIFCRSQRIVSDLPIAVQIDSTLGSVRIPSSGEFSTSGIPPTLLATTGVPHAIDSSRTFGHPSRELASTLAFAALYQVFRSWFGTDPTSVT